MTYFLIAVIVMVALSPLISMMPSRRQRHIAALRQKAALCGLIMQLRALPNAADSTELLPFYARRRQRGDRKPPNIAVYRRDGDGWNRAAGTVPNGRWDAAPVEMTQLLSQLPQGVSHVWETLYDVGMFWDERGAETDVETISEVLSKLLE